MKKSSIAILVAGLVGAGAVHADVSGNIAASSDYVWRGLTQTKHSSAVSGGIDYSHNSGLYLGGWASNIAGDTEIDLYGGFGGDVQGFGYDIGYIAYVYPASALPDFTEVYLGLSYDGFSGKYSYDPDGKNGYLEAAYGGSLQGLDLGVHVGSYSFDTPANGEDYIDYNVSIGKTIPGTEWSWSATLNFVNMDKSQDPNPFPFMSVSRSFDL